MSSGSFFPRPFLHCPCPNFCLAARRKTFGLNMSDVAVEEVLSTSGSENTFIAKYNVGAQDV